MNAAILKKEVQDWLKTKEEFRQLALQKSPFHGITMSELAEQIKGRKIAKTKFPDLFNCEGIYYPPSLNLEQASSEITAAYKAKLFSGNSLIDLTAGLGIDAKAFSASFKEVTALERNFSLTEINTHNIKQLKIHNLKFINSTFEDYFQQNPGLRWDIIYLDPSRRNQTGRKFLLEELEPDITKWLDIFLTKASKVLIKLSPVLDLKNAIMKLGKINRIYLIANKNDLKEFLIFCTNQENKNPEIHTVDLAIPENEFVFNFLDEKNLEPKYSSPLLYIYEPGVALMKSGAYKSIGKAFDIRLLAPNTRLFTSEEIKDRFQGRIYKVIEEIKNAKKEIIGGKYHVISRNHPLSVPEIRKKYKLKEGREETLIFTKSTKGKHILLCERLQ